ncbi:MAG: hypothetical protein GY697_16580, partial [Desulfobacterales bacterium]|nr:hypothetical protein [Desulfobacterales bacterium]
KRALGDPAVPRTDYVYVVNARRDKIAMTISAYPLVEPAGAWLLLGETRPEERARLESPAQE